MIIDNPEDIDLYSIMSKRSALVLEMRGMKRRGRSAYSLIKEEFGLKGSKQKVFEQLTEIIEVIIEYKKGEMYNE
jgi:hypothetical protein